MLSPTAFEGSTSRPLIRALLSFPELRARYLAHLETIVVESLDWSVLGPVVARFQGLIDADVRADDKKLYGYDAFVASAGTGTSGGVGFGGGSPGLRAYVDTRRAYLLSHPEIATPQPTISDLVVRDTPRAAAAVRVTARVAPGGTSAPLRARLYYSPDPNLPYRVVDMADDGHGTWGATIPGHPAGTVMRYYVEAMAGSGRPVASYAPARAEGEPASYRIPAERAAGSAVVINELLATGASGADWIELHNRGERAVDLAGMYLTDRADEPRKWIFPASASIPAGGYVVVWADEDNRDSRELHASFKLSAEGERVMLVDTDTRGNGILDEVVFGPQAPRVSLGRDPDGTGVFSVQTPTPGERNRP